MKKMIFAALLWLSAASLGLAQNPPPGPGEIVGNDIAERVESQETSSSDQKTLVKEIAEAARKAGTDNPNDAAKVKEIVRKKLDEIRDRQSAKDKPGGKKNSEIDEWVKKLKRDLMDNKYVSMNAKPRFSIDVITKIPLGKIEPNYGSIDDIRAAAFDPAVVEQLFEKLGGEFFIGEWSSSNTKPVEMYGTTQTMPGLQFGIHLGKGFEIHAAAQHFRTKWSARFPVVVYPQDLASSQQPKTLQGNLNASASGILGEAGLSYFFGKRRVQPYLSGGVRGQFATQKNSGAEIAGVRLPVTINTISTDYTPFWGIGIRVTYWKKGFAEIGSFYGKIPGGKYIPTLGLGIGWRF